MLPKRNRLKGQESFTFLYRKGRRWSHEAVVLYYLRDLPAEEGVKIGVSVSKKVSKRAVDRNRLRRLFFEAIRPMVPDLAGLRMMVVVKKKMMEMDLEEVRSLLTVWSETMTRAKGRQGSI